MPKRKGAAHNQTPEMALTANAAVSVCAHLTECVAGRVDMALSRRFVSILYGDPTQQPDSFYARRRLKRFEYLVTSIEVTAMKQKPLQVVAITNKLRQYGRCANSIAGPLGGH
jgi:hypothetical protein